MFSGDAYAASSFTALPDGTVTGTAYASSLSDSSTSSDFAASLVVVNSAVSEISAGTDAILALKTVDAQVNEVANAINDLFSSILTYPVSVQEQVKVQRVDVLGFGFSTGSFASGPFDALGYGIALFPGDTFSTTIVGSYTLSENVTISDPVVANINVPVSFSATSTISDSVGATPEYPASLSESATGSEEFSSISTYLCRIEEIGTASTTESTLAELGSVISELVIGTDTPTSLFVVNAAVSEQVNSLDRPFAQYITSPVAVDMAQAIDTISVRLQWENIDTSETLDWTLIKTL